LKWTFARQRLVPTSKQVELQLVEPEMDRSTFALVAKIVGPPPTKLPQVQQQLLSQPPL
jgi:hypothetical protein